MTDQIYPTKLQLNKASSFDNEAPFGLGLVIISSIIHDKLDDLNFETVNYPLLMEMFLTPLPMVYIFRSLFDFRKYVLMLATDFEQQQKPISDCFVIKTRLKIS